MNPGNQLIEDLKLGCLIALISVPLLYIMVSFGGYAPADECANAVKNGMNYTRKQMLVNAEPTYNNIRAWCVVNIEHWESKLNEARDYQTADYQY